MCVDILTVGRCFRRELPEFVIPGGPPVWYEAIFAEVCLTPDCVLHGIETQGEINFLKCLYTGDNDVSRVLGIKHAIESSVKLAHVQNTSATPRSLAS